MMLICLGKTKPMFWLTTKSWFLSFSLATALSWRTCKEPSLVWTICRTKWKMSLCLIGPLATKTLSLKIGLRLKAIMWAQTCTNGLTWCLGLRSEETELSSQTTCFNLKRWRKTWSLASWQTIFKLRHCKRRSDISDNALCRYSSNLLTLREW